SSVASKTSNRVTRMPEVTVAKPPPAEQTFEQSLAELEQVMRVLEDGTTGLDDALAAYERGVGLLKSCYDQLRQAEQRILKLTGTDDEGRPILQAFDHSAAVEVDRPDAKRRKAKPAE